MKIINKLAGSVQKTVKGIIFDMAVMFAPKDDRTVTEVVADGFKLPEGGSFDPEMTPYTVEPLNRFKDRMTHMIVYVSPARAGKTITLIGGGVYYIATVDPADTLIVHVTQQTAGKFSKLTIARMFQNSPSLKKLLPENRDSDNVLQKLLRNGMALIIGFPAPSQLAATDYKYVLITDSDRSLDDNGQGEWIKQADKRTQTFGSGGKVVLESSPSRDIVDPEWKKKTRHEAPATGGILGWYNQGDRRIEYWECLHCNDEIMLYPNLDLFCLPDRAELIKELKHSDKMTVADKYNRIYCPSCGAELLPEDRPALMKTSKWHKEFPDSPNNFIKSYWGSHYSAAFQTWESILLEEFTALMYWHNTGDESKLRATANVDRGAPYLPISMEGKLNASELKKRAYDFGEKVVPEGVFYLIANVDTQKWKWVVSVEGIGKGNQRWLIDRYDVNTSDRLMESGGGGYEFVQPASYVEDWDKLTEEVIKKTYMLGDNSGRTMGIEHTVCDMHGTDGVTENAYKYAKKLKYDEGLGDAFTLLRGERPNPRTNQPLVTMSKLDKTSKSAISARVVGLLTFVRVNTTIGKDVVAGMLNRTEIGSGYIHFSKYLPDFVFDECTVEVRTDKGWDNPLKKRNEQFDLFCYGLVNLKLIELRQYGETFDWDHPPPFAREWDTNTNVRGTDYSDSVKDRQKQSDHAKLVQSRNIRR